MRVVVLLVLVIAMFGCGRQSPDRSVYDGPVNTCLEDDECPPGAVCNQELMHCVVEEGLKGRQYYIKVIPSSDLSVPAQAFKVVLDEGGEAMVELPDGGVEPPVVQGLQQIYLRRQELEVKAVIVHTGMVIPGHSARTDVYTIPKWKTGRPRNFNFEMLPGIYRIEATPSEEGHEEYPVKHWNNVTITNRSGIFVGSENNVQQPLSGLAIPRSQIQVVGVIKRGSQPVDGVEVEARDQGTGRVLSTRSTTGCLNKGTNDDEICGEFAIWLAPGTSAFSLRVFRAEQPWYPVVTGPVFFIDSSSNNNNIIDRGVIELAALATPVLYRARVEKTVTLKSGKSERDGVPGCQVLFSSDNVAGGRVEYSVFTNEGGELEDMNGNVGVSLFPASYNITIIPPQPSYAAKTDYAVSNWSSQVDISGSGELGGQVFSLQERPRLSGNVVVEKELVPGGILVGEPLRDSSEYARANSALINASGSFVLRLDHGRYRLTARAHSLSGYAWGIFTMDVTEDVQQEIELTIPLAAELNLVSGNSSAGARLISGATVEWYKEISGQSYLVQETTTDSKGKVTAFLPP